MRAEYILDLMENRSKPIINLYNMRTLIDTGADVPVCYLDTSVLIRMFHATLVADDIEIGTVSGIAVGSVYDIELFHVAGLTFPHMIVFVPKLEIGKERPEYSIILSASMFYNLSYEIDMKNKKFMIRVPDDEQLVRHPIAFNKENKKFILCDDRPQE